MKISLRKAAKLRNHIDNLLSTIDCAPSVSIKVVDPDAIDQVNKAAEKMQANFARFKTLNSVLYDIRKKIANQNDQSGVSRLLTEKGKLERERQFLRRFENVRTESVMPSKDQLAARISSFKEHLNSTESYYDFLHVGLVSEDMMESAKDTVQTLEKQIYECQEQIEELNSTAQIQLSDHELSILSQEKIPI